MHEQALHCLQAIAYTSFPAGNKPSNQWWPLPMHQLAAAPLHHQGTPDHDGNQL